MNGSNDSRDDRISRFPRQSNQPPQNHDQTGVASAILRGEASYLVAGQATVIGGTEGHEIYRLNLEGECRIGVWDKSERVLVVFDTAALCALATREAQASRAGER